MDILVALIAALVLAVALRPALMCHPSVVYIAVVAIDLVFLGGVVGNILPDLEREMLPFLRRGILPYALFVVVMYLGVFPEGSRLRAFLKPVRGQLSIVAALLAVCHLGSYLPIYLHVALQGFVSAESSTTVALCLAVLVIGLLTALTVTSFNVVRRHMTGAVWRRVQQLSYVFFVLVTLHAVLLLLPASAVRPAAALSVSLYVGILLCYGILRVARWASVRYSDCRIEVSGAAIDEDEAFSGAI